MTVQTLVTTQRRWALGAALVALLAIVWGSLGDRVLGGPATVMAWRVATVALIGVLAYKAPLLRAMWQGRLHVSCDTVRSIPFCDSEMRSSWG